MKKGIEYLRKMLYENPLFINRIISKDGKTTAIYVPLEKGANGKEVADKIRKIVKEEKGDEQYYIAGDPVARDTFGAEMFNLWPSSRLLPGWSCSLLDTLCSETFSYPLPS